MTDEWPDLPERPAAADRHPIPESATDWLARNLPERDYEDPQPDPQPAAPPPSRRDSAENMAQPSQDSPVDDGAELLDAALSLLRKHCVMPAEAAWAVVLWCATTHALPALPFAPRLAIRSATKQSGKSRVLEVVAALCHRPLKTINATVPAIFRSLGDDHPPTLLFDEVDTIFGSAKVAESNEDLRGLLNAGFERGNPTLRCVGPLQVPTEFPSFSMAALAGISHLPDTIEDRSIRIFMRKRKPSEKVTPFRSRRDRPRIEHIGGLLGEWLSRASVRESLFYADPPESELDDRPADVWEALFMIADLAGGHWPQRARDAAKALTAAGPEIEHPLNVRLLHDIENAFESIKSEFVPTEVLLANLRAMRESPWADMDLTPHRMARMLKDFAVRSRSDGQRRGYRRFDLQDAWERYPRDVTEGDYVPGA